MAEHPVGGGRGPDEPAASRTTSRERAAAAWQNPRLTFRRLFGLDRSGPPPPQTLSDAPWNVWTIPNAIGFVRLALIAPLLILGLSSESGTDAWPAILFAVIGWSDYADGIAARVTGQYSRFGALLDPVVDRMLVVSGLLICWKFETLPRWGIAVLLAREVYLLVAGQLALRRGLELKINWWGALGRVADDERDLLRDGRSRHARPHPVLLRPGPLADGRRRLHPGRPERNKRCTLKLSLSSGLSLLFSPGPSPGGEGPRMDTFPDLGSLSDQELKDLIQQLTEEEVDISYRRRILHGKIDILRAELVNRLRKRHEGGEEVITGADVQRLTDILAGRASGEEPAGE